MGTPELGRHGLNRALQLMPTKLLNTQQRASLLVFDVGLLGVHDSQQAIIVRPNEDGFDILALASILQSLDDGSRIGSMEAPKESLPVYPAVFLATLFRDLSQA